MTPRPFNAKTESHMKNTTITIENGVATVTATETSKAIAFFASLNESERLDVLESARLALKDDECLDRMDMDTEFAKPLQEKIEEFMQ